MLDRMEGRAAPADGPFPEDWIGSTVRAINPNRDIMNEGLARVMSLRRRSGAGRLWSAPDPEYFLGAAHVANVSARIPMVLVKYLDSRCGCRFRLHPTVEFSRRRLNAESGKTEVYYILSTRPEVTEPYIYLGFQHPPTREELRRKSWSRTSRPWNVVSRKSRSTRRRLYRAGRIAPRHRRRRADGGSDGADGFRGARGV